MSRPNTKYLRWLIQKGRYGRAARTWHAIWAYSLSPTRAVMLKWARA